MSSTRDALEAALVAEPENVALHSAYADYLMEEGDPRGEYIRLQLEQEDRDQPAERLRELEQKAFEIRQAHEREWLGSLAEFVFRERRTVGQMANEHLAITWRRGWIHSVTVYWDHERSVKELSECRFARLLHTLEICSQLSSNPPQTRRFLRTLDKLSICELILDDHPTLGDALVTALVKRPIFSRLCSLSLRNCGITDEGATALANRSSQHDIPKLDLSDNFITAVGLDALKQVGHEKVGHQFLGLGGINEDYV
jgi:uncharacterized protein (TIGR02996 family)